MRTSKVVEQILNNDPVARDSDRRLILGVWEHYGLVLTREQRAKFMDMPSLETVVRIRRHLQEHGMYPASERINEARYNKFKNVRQNINTVEPSKLLDNIPWGNTTAIVQVKMFEDDNED